MQKIEIDNIFERYASGVAQHIRPNPERGALMIVLQDDRVGARWLPLCVLQSWVDRPQAAIYPDAEHLLNLACELNPAEEVAFIVKRGSNLTMGTAERPKEKPQTLDA